MIKTGLPIELTQYLKTLLDIKIFVETGTGLGRTAKIASEIFNRIYTIEAHKLRYENAKKKFSGSNVNCIFGESPEALKKLLETEVNEQSVVFLDAHCGYRKKVTTNACPILEEIYIVVNQDHEHVIIIDDAFSFLSRPPNPSRRNEYPEMANVIGELVCKNYPYIFVEGKSIVAAPRHTKEHIDKFLYEMNEGKI